MQWHRCGLIASWEFVEEHVEKTAASDDQFVDKATVQKHSEKKWGAMVITKSLQFLPVIISAALKETTSATNKLAGPTGHGNMMHIALAGVTNQMSSLQDRCETCFSYIFNDKIDLLF